MKSLRITASRKEILQSFAAYPHTRLLIIGGGIHGAAIARVAALNGMDCVLLEKQDYAAGTSSRSTKLAHGGLRYLESFDFQQVFEGIKAREELFVSAPHVCRPWQFLIPVKKNDWWFRLKLGMGLYLYDLMCQAKERKHTWIPGKKLHFEGFKASSEELMGCFMYCDGIMNDARLVIESVVQAREWGARCINYVGVHSVEKNSEGTFTVKAIDEFTKEAYTLTADVVINCAGPWAPCIGNKESETLQNNLRYSAGIHLLFNRPWTQPAMFLPMEEKTRYYFVLPHPAGTMVGTTEREVTEVPFEQYPIEQEVEEILTRLKKDLPDVGLNRDTMHYAFAGVRTLPLRDAEKQTATISRKHIWKDVGGVLTLLGGKYTTSAWTAYEGFLHVCKMLKIGTQKIKSLNGVSFPGKATPKALKELEDKLVHSGIKNSTAERIVRRLGNRTEYLFEKPDRLEVLSENLTKGEVELAATIEQAVTVEDVLRRRTEIEYLPGNGLPELESVGKLLTQYRDTAVQIDDVTMYQQRIEKLRRIMRKD